MFFIPAFDRGIVCRRINLGGKGFFRSGTADLGYDALFLTVSGPVVIHGGARGSSRLIESADYYYRRGPAAWFQNGAFRFF